MRKSKKKNIIIGCLIIVVIIIICSCLFVKNNSKYAHISIDDSTIILQEICNEQYDSIFDQATLSSLKELHEQYGIVCVLYLFYRDNGFELTEMPEIYKSEFEENSDWLKLGFHWHDNTNPNENVIPIEVFEDYYQKVNSEIVRFAGESSIAKLLRLHYWYGTDEIIAFLESQGVEGVFCPDDKASVGYNLTQEEQETLVESESGIFYSTQGEMKYILTDVRLEHSYDITDKLKEESGDRIKVIFTHANYYIDNEYEFETAIKWLNENDYQFSLLED